MHVMINLIEHGARQNFRIFLLLNSLRDLIVTITPELWSMRHKKWEIKRSDWAFEPQFQFSYHYLVPSQELLLTWKQRKSSCTWILFLFPIHCMIQTGYKWGAGTEKKLGPIISFHSSHQHLPLFSPIII